VEAAEVRPLARPGLVVFAPVVTATVATFLFIISWFVDPLGVRGNG